MRSWLGRRWKALLTGVVCLEIFVSVFGCANAFLLHPSTNHLDSADAVSRMVDVEGKKVEVYTARSPACNGADPKAYVLEFTGNGSRAEGIASWVANDRWKQWPVEVWVMNYPGFGQSEGKATLKSIPPAALAAYDTLHQTDPTKPIFIEANSLGSAVTLYVASKRPASAIILTNPPPLRRIIMQRHGWWNLWLLAVPVTLQIPLELNAIDTAPKVSVPACVTSAAEDAMVPTKYQDMVIAAYAGPLKLIRIPGVGHNNPLTEASEAELKQWIDQQWNRIFPDPKPAEHAAK